MQLAMEGKSLEEAMIVLAERIDTICNTKEEALRNNFRKSKLFLVQMTYQKAGKVYEKDRPKAPSCNSRLHTLRALSVLREMPRHLQKKSSANAEMCDCPSCFNPTTGVKLVGATKTCRAICQTQVPTSHLITTTLECMHQICILCGVKKIEGRWKKVTGT